MGKPLNRWFLAAILLGVLSLLIKLSGLDWGFPNVFHNDESNVVRSSLGMRFGDLNPHHFDWPSLYFYINYFVFAMFIKLRVGLQLLFTTEKMQTLFPFWWLPDTPFYYLSRLLSSTFLSLNIILVYLLAKEYKLSDKLSFFASVIFSSGVLSNFFSFYGIADTGFAFFTTLTAYFCIKILKNGKLNDYILAGIFAGITTSVKYNGVIMCLLIFIAHVLYERKIKIFDKRLFTAAFFSVLLFFIGTPYAALDWDTFTRTDSAHGALWQLNHMGHGLNWAYHLFTTAPENFGWLATGLGLISSYFIIKSKNKNFAYLLITYFLLLLYIGSWGITRQHYSLPLFPFFAILISISFLYLKENLNRNSLIILGVIILVPSILKNSIELIKRNSEDTRNLSGQWVNENIKHESCIFTYNSLTGYFGGGLSVFDYDKYEIHRVQDQEHKPAVCPEDSYFISIDGQEYLNDKLIYKVDNKYRTGPIIEIYKINQ